MAPYSSNSFDHADIDPFVDAPPLDSPALKQQQREGYDTPTTDNTTVEGEEEETASVFDNFLDCSLCFNSGKSSFPAAMNPSPSAVFKARSCAECGGKCTKLQGYKKEEVLKTIALEVDEETGEEKEMKESTKMYYHKWCHQVKEYRDEHQHRDDGDDYESVMRNLLDYFRALELEAQLKKEAELRRKEQAEEALRLTLAQELAQAAKVDAEAEAKKQKKPSKLLKNVKKSFSMKKKDKTDKAKADKDDRSIASSSSAPKTAKKSFSLKKKDKDKKKNKSDKDQDDDSSVTSSVASVKKSFSLKKKKKDKADNDDCSIQSGASAKKSFSLKKKNKDKKKNKSDNDDCSIQSGASAKKSFSLKKKKKSKAEKENNSSEAPHTATTTKGSKPTKAKPLSARQAALANVRRS